MVEQSISPEQEGEYSILYYITCWYIHIYLLVLVSRTKYLYIIDTLVFGNITYKYICLCTKTNLKIDFANL